MCGMDRSEGEASPHVFLDYAFLSDLPIVLSMGVNGKVRGSHASQRCSLPVVESHMFTTPKGNRASGHITPVRA